MKPQSNDLVAELINAIRAREKLQENGNELVLTTDNGFFILAIASAGYRIGGVGSYKNIPLQSSSYTQLIAMINEAQRLQVTRERPAPSNAARIDIVLYELRSLRYRLDVKTIERRYD